MQNVVSTTSSTNKRLNQSRQDYANKTLVMHPTENELHAFETLQHDFADIQKLAHFDLREQSYSDLVACRERHNDVTKPPPRTHVRPILFLSQVLTPAEKNYWPTELEVSCFIWVQRKLRHMLQAARDPPIVYTDHVSTVALSTQTTFNTVAVEKLILYPALAVTYSIIRLPFMLMGRQANAENQPSMPSAIAP